MNTKRKPKPKAGKPSVAGRRSVLAQWRGIDLTPLEVALAPTTRTVSSLMPAVLKGMGFDQRRVHAEIIKVWSHLIDANVVAHAQPTGLRRGTLFVTVDSSPWLNEIVRYQRKEILERLQHSFGSELITRISFRVG
jgi:hypothetical protein